MIRRVVILGSTGSIGTQALDVARAFPELFSIQGLSCFSNIDAFISQVNEFKPPFVAVSTDAQKQQLLNTVRYSPTVFVGDSGLVDLVSVDMDLLLVAIVGTAVLPPVCAAIETVDHIAIANKEVLVAAGSFIMPMVHQHKTMFIPVDSEH